MVEEQRVNTRKVGEFLALAFGIAWVGALGLYVSGVELGTTLGTVLLVVVFMWAPAISAILVQLWYEEPIREGGGLAVGRLRWVAIAWLAPLALVGATIAVGAALPGVSFSTDYTAFFLEQGLTQEQADESLAELEALPVPPVVVFVAMGLATGLTINALAAFGEELGWRGVLLTELAPLGFWKVSLITGLAWGLWHAPIILQGHNFPEAPVVGVAMMTVATIVLSPVYTYLTVRAETVLAATFLHGTYNALGGLALIYLSGAGNLVIAPVGVAGIVGALLVVGGCLVHDRYLAAESITTGEPLAPWGR
ncbi:CPBP family intramembrane glutamic endopeptidase [Natrononativus amylolyticus]|uniref:CPBP family intramembrane glutamic endopeptidase n=1 Tax=Natrononativus amylolyticus TaxID=2963434 RepID=UPI0020CD4BF4|nr:CPBP family intramembrane glutamic endopeptidase [Natrononativus amylolyticus]